jgi:hypothetical protein
MTILVVSMDRRGLHEVLPLAAEAAQRRGAGLTVVVAHRPAWSWAWAWAQLLDVPHSPELARAALASREVRMVLGESAPAVSVLCPERRQELEPCVESLLVAGSIDSVWIGATGRRRGSRHGADGLRRRADALCPAFVFPVRCPPYPPGGAGAGVGMARS